MSWVIRAPSRELERAEKKLYTRVRRVLWDYEPLRASHAEIDIGVVGGAVVLRGRVRTLPQKLIARVLVERMTDVGEVTNELVADPEVVRAVADALAKDERTAAYVREVGAGDFTPLASDAGAKYEQVHGVNLSEIEPQVAAPEYPANAHPVGEYKGVKVNQGFIGTCTNGRIEDLRMAAGILRGRKVKAGVRLVITPASFFAYRLAEKEGLLEIFQNAGANVTSSECGLCVRQSLSAGEVCVSSGNRNYRGRMGPKESSVFLSNAATVAASAVAGEIADPREFV